MRPVASFPARPLESNLASWHSIYNHGSFLGILPTHKVRVARSFDGGDCGDLSNGGSTGRPAWLIAGICCSINVEESDVSMCLYRGGSYKQTCEESDCFHDVIKIDE